MNISYVDDNLLIYLLVENGLMYLSICHQVFSVVVRDCW